MIEKILEQKEIIEALQRNEKSLLKIMKRYEDYKLRIDKAIEYIRSQYTITDDDVYLALYSSDGTLDKLEKILKGNDKK